jgi:hypothetical protein
MFCAVHGPALPCHAMQMTCHSRNHNVNDVPTRSGTAKAAVMMARRRDASGRIAAPSGITDAVSSAIVNVSAASWACDWVEHIVIDPVCQTVVGARQAAC